MPRPQDERINPPNHRLKIRSPIWADVYLDQPSYLDYEWNGKWEEASTNNKNLVVDATAKVNGFSLPGYLWRKLIRIRTGHGRCNDMMYIWGLAPLLLVTAEHTAKLSPT